MTQAGFERGTGVLINVMPPELAAETLRAVAHPRALSALTRIVGQRRVRRPAERRCGGSSSRSSDHVEWMADAESIRFVTSQRRGVGTRFTCVTAVGPIRLDDRMEITEWEPGRAMGVRHDGLVTGTGRFALDAAGRRPADPVHVGRGAPFPWWLGGPVGARSAARP